MLALKKMSDNNLPPGVTTADLPGNTTEDVVWDAVLDWIIVDTDISALALQGLVAGWCKRTGCDPVNRRNEMNKEQTKKAAEVMLAWAEGKEARCRPKGSQQWYPMGDDHTWDWNCMEYELKPEKLVKYVNLYPDCSGGGYTTREKADRQAGRNRIACVRVDFEEGQFDE